MGDRVVHVEQIQILPLHHLVLLGGKRQGVRVVLEQWIPSHPGIHLVEIDPLGVAPEAKRRGIGDEVHLVTPPGQFQSEFGGHGSRSAVCRVAGDADLHLRHRCEVM